MYPDEYTYYFQNYRMQVRPVNAKGLLGVSTYTHVSVDDDVTGGPIYRGVCENHLVTLVILQAIDRHGKAYAG